VAASLEVDAPATPASVVEAVVENPTE